MSSYFKYKSSDRNKNKSKMYYSKQLSIFYKTKKRFYYMYRHFLTKVFNVIILQEWIKNNKHEIKIIKSDNTVWKGLWSSLLRKLLVNEAEVREEVQWDE